MAPIRDLIAVAKRGPQQLGACLDDSSKAKAKVKVKAKAGILRVVQILER